eukprot:COSAG06_NODE_3050_length_5918_cov_3.943461_3_plen_181_part_00
MGISGSRGTATEHRHARPCATVTRPAERTTAVPSDEPIRVTAAAALVTGSRSSFQRRVSLRGAGRALGSAPRRGCRRQAAAPSVSGGTHLRTQLFRQPHTCKSARSRAGAAAASSGGRRQSPCPCPAVLRVAEARHAACGHLWLERSQHRRHTPSAHEAQPQSIAAQDLAPRPRHYLSRL